MTEETQNAFGKRIGVSQPRVAQLLARGMPRSPSGKVHVEAALEWLKANRQEPPARRTEKPTVRPVPDADVSLAEALRRKEIARAERERLKADAEAASLLPRADVEQLFEATILTFKAALESLPGRMCSELAGMSDPALIRGALQLEHRRILADLSGRLATLTMATGHG